MSLPSVAGTGTARIEAASCFMCSGLYPGQVFATTIAVKDTNDDLEVPCEMCLEDPELHPDEIIRKTAGHNRSIPTDTWENQVRKMVQEARKLPQ